MRKRLSKGIIYIEKTTMLYLIIILILIIVFFYFLNKIISKYFKLDINKDYKNINCKNNENNNNENNENNKLTGIYPRPSYSYSNIADDILLNPYKAPLKDGRYYPNMEGNNKIPININTRALDSTYRQVGILKRNSSKETMLPLIGRPLFPARDKWNFYTISETNNMIKLPVSHKKQSCTSEYGCDNLYTGDVVYVEGYNDTFKVTIYENETYRYIPYV